MTRLRPPAYTISLERPYSGDVVQLIAALDQYLAALYPAESNHGLSVEQCRAADVAFYVARSRATGEAVACGAYRRVAEYAEVKRMYVAPEWRMHGLGRALLERLHAEACREGLHTVRLETGVRQPEASALYESVGYRPIPPFGEYAPDPLSVFYELRLGTEMR